jgi:hypothetical protein
MTESPNLDLTGGRLNNLLKKKAFATNILSLLLQMYNPSLED